MASLPAGRRKPTWLFAAQDRTFIGELRCEGLGASKHCGCGFPRSALD